MAFSCKCRGFCPSCQARRAEEWTIWLIDHRLEQVPHHHVIFTIPKMLRAYFRYDRSLLNDLSRAANLVVLNYLRILLGTDVTPGLVIARHTFGEGARFHPHLHAIVTGGGWDSDSRWHTVSGWDRPVLRELFQIEVFRFLLERELLNAERIELIRSWRHSGFDVYVGQAIKPDNRELLEHIARYLLRAPVSLERMWYNPEAGTVKIRPLANPLLCPECGGEMRIISFITKPSAVDKILRHIRWHPGKQLAPYIRTPPEMLKFGALGGLKSCIMLSK